MTWTTANLIDRSKKPGRSGPVLACNTGFGQFMPKSFADNDSALRYSKKYCSTGDFEPHLPRRPRTLSRRPRRRTVDHYYRELLLSSDFHWSIAAIMPCTRLCATAAIGDYRRDGSRRAIRPKAAPILLRHFARHSRASPRITPDFATKPPRRQGISKRMEPNGGL